VIIMEA